MKYLFEIQEKIVPELITLAELRYTILRTVHYNQPIGRRGLARTLEVSERRVRNELDFLEDKGLVEITKAGTKITVAGKDFLNELDEYIKEIKDIKNLEKQLENIFGLEDVFVVPGELKYASVKQEIGRFTAGFIRDLLTDGDILAVTGGSTLAQVAKLMKFKHTLQNVMVVPGRGGIGERVEVQANTIAAEIAKKLGGKYRLLHIPDNIKKENISMITAEPSIQKTLEYLENTNILLHGVGTSREMASRRGMTPEQIDNIIQKGAIGEAFGIYFDHRGEIVYSTTCVGLSLESLANINKVIAVAGGISKAKAIKAVVSPKYQDILITDELTAKKIISLEGGDNWG